MNTAPSTTPPITPRTAQPTKSYSLFDPPYLYTIQQRQRALLRLLRGHGITTLADKRILELGCGRGGVLHEYLAYGAAPGMLHGIDLIPDRLRLARELLPMLPIACADGSRLPYPAESFDMALQYTVFSSILDSDIRHRVAADMMRVLRPGGLIIWYDFWINPLNRHTRGIRIPEIRDLFPGCALTHYRITLAPPLAERTVPISWTLSSVLEKLRILNTHFLVGIRKP
jgi:ubiquinone/menaquinone biosynthesis C-methylase UbiE